MAIADAPTIRMVRDTQNPDMMLLDGPLVASQEFAIELHVDGVGAGELHIWPNKLAPCDGPPPEPGKAQTYRFAMSPVKVGDTNILRARVPALEGNQEFCFRVTAAGQPNQRQIMDMATVLVEALVDEEICTATPDGFVDRVSPDLDALRAHEHLLGNSRAIALRAHEVFMHQGGLETCKRYAETMAKSETSQENLQAAIKDRQDLLTAIADLDPLPGRDAPLVATTSGLRPASALIDVEVGTTVLTAAIGTLARRQRQMNGDDALVSWIAWLKRLAAAENRSREIRRIRRERRRARPLQTFELQIQGQVVLATEVQRKAASFDPADILAQLDQAPEGPIRDAWQWSFTALRDRDRQIAALTTETQTAQQELANSFQELEQIAGKLQERIAELVQRRVTWNIQPRRSRPQKTDSAQNFISPDAGVLLGFPIGVAGADPWVVPYLGFNLYLVPVDRTVDFDQLVGNYVLQRLSVTVGFTLSTPSTPGQAIDPLFLNRVPLAALGWRLTHYTRISAGSVFFYLRDANPASAAKSFQMAPYVAASLDVDLVTLIKHATSAIP